MGAKYLPENNGGAAFLDHVVESVKIAYDRGRGWNLLNASPPLPIDKTIRRRSASLPPWKS